MTEDFKEGYTDGVGQACSNMEFMIIDCIKNGIEITEELVTSIADRCRKVDEEYLNQ